MTTFSYSIDNVWLIVMYNITLQANVSYSFHIKQDMSTFQVIGHTPRHSQQVSIPQLPSSSPLYHSDSLDSLGEDTLSDDEEDDGEIREDEDSLLEWVDTYSNGDSNLNTVMP